MSVKAKFEVASITDFGTQKEVNLQAVYGDGDANKEWSKYTPSGNIKINITNPDAFNQFEVGKDYYVTFEKA